MMTRLLRSGCAVAAAALVGAMVRPASATYSIAAVDRASSQVGGAGASCIGQASVRVIYGVAPGKGVVHAQALINEDGRDEAVSRLERDAAPADIIAFLASPGFDPFLEQRQYGVVDLVGRAAAFSGDDNGDFAGDRQGEVGSFTYTAQGNILTGPGVIDRAAAAFEGAGCDLADRLMLALEAGAENGEGDSRCTDDGIPADSAFLQVDLPDAAPGTYLVLEVTGSGADSPIAQLRAAYEVWRADNPCPSSAPDAGPDPDAGQGPGPDAGPEPGSDAGPGGGGADDGDDAEGGCGCRAGARTSSFAALLGLALAIAAARRRHRR
jgi:uncharacterized Ntn-hydrolase superfamily protein